MNKKFVTALALAAMLGIGQKANAAGFALIEQSVSGMGTAYAGGSAAAEDVSQMWFNPAGLSRVCGDEMANGFHVVIPVADYDDKGSIAIADPVGPTFQPLTGNDGRDAGSLAAVGHFAMARKINDCLAVGFTMNSPFGLVTSYDSHWKGRYHAIRSALLTINFNPALSYRINKCLSFGAGFSAQYLHAKLSNAVDFGLIGADALGLSAAAGLGLVPQQSDGKVIIKGNSWGWGWNTGVLWEPSCRTRIGLHYRSSVRHKIDGKERFKDVPAGIGQVGPLAAVFQDTRAKSTVSLPGSASISGYHEFNNCFGMMADVTWTNWKVLKRLRFRFNNPDQDDGITTLKWEDTFRYAVGGFWRPYKCLTLRTGVAYDETPIPNKELRTPRIPDEDRIWATVGAEYKWSKSLRFDFGYAHLFVKTPKIDKSGFEYEEDLLRGGLKGDYNAYTDIISLQVVWDF